LRRLDLAMPISGATLRAMRERTGGAPDARVIPLGVNPLALPDAASSMQIGSMLGVADATPVILTAGRLVRRKGVAWFVRNVLPLLRADAIYVVIGEGPEQAAIVRAAEEAGVASRVRLLGRVPDGVLAAAYARADVFVMPNVPVPGDMEGFGLVALEAAASGLPVVAAALEGITEAVRHGRNGLLVPPQDARAFVDQIECLLRLSPIQLQAMGARFATHTREHYGWDSTARQYVKAMRSVVRDGRHHHVAGAAVEER
jgi:phosphatidylinositol alpha-1,6-mannosyltransferase